MKIKQKDRQFDNFVVIGSTVSCRNDWQLTEIILWTRPTNERRRYIVTSSLTDWAHSQNDRWTYGATSDDKVVTLTTVCVQFIDI